MAGRVVPAGLPSCRSPPRPLSLLALSVWLAGSTSSDTSPTASMMLVPSAAATLLLPPPALPSLPSLLATLVALAEGPL